MEKKEKKNSLSGFPCLDCFARVTGRKTTSSGLTLLQLMQAALQA